MKHVFFLHSHVTWLVSLGVIRHHELAYKDILFVCSRGYEPPVNEFESLQFPDRNWLSPWRPDKSAQDKQELARFVDQVAQNDDFYWYLPHTGFPFFLPFINHPHCLGFCLIEEGIGSYFTPEALKRSMQRTAACMPGWKGWVYRLWYLLRPPELADNRYLFVYGCTEDAFPGYARKIKVDFVGAPLPPRDAIVSVLVFDNLVEAGLIDEISFGYCVDEILKILAQQGEQTIHYKLHPGQYIDQRYTPRLLERLECNPYGVKLIELPADYCLELLATTGQPKFYVFISSVGYYAAISGCRVYSMASRLADYNSRYKILMETIPPVMSQRITFIENPNNIENKKTSKSNR